MQSTDRERETFNDIQCKVQIGERERHLTAYNASTDRERERHLTTYNANDTGQNPGKATGFSSYLCRHLIQVGLERRPL